MTPRNRPALTNQNPLSEISEIQFKSESLWQKALDARSKRVRAIAKNTPILARVDMTLHHVDLQQHESLCRIGMYTLGHTLLRYSGKGKLGLLQLDANPVHNYYNGLRALVADKTTVAEANQKIYKCMQNVFTSAALSELLCLKESISTQQFSFDALDSTFMFHPEFLHEGSISLGVQDWADSNNPVLFGFKALVNLVYCDLLNRVTSFQDTETLISEKIANLAGSVEDHLAFLSTCVMSELNVTGYLSPYLLYLMWCVNNGRLNASPIEFLDAFIEGTMLESAYSMYKMAWNTQCMLSLNKLLPLPAKEMLLEGIDPNATEDYLLAKFESVIYPAKEPEAPRILDAKGQAILPENPAPVLPQDYKGKSMIEMLDDLLARIL